MEGFMRREVLHDETQAAFGPRRQGGCGPQASQSDGRRSCGPASSRPPQDRRHRGQDQGAKASAATFATAGEFADASTAGALAASGRRNIESNTTTPITSDLMPDLPKASKTAINWRTSSKYNGAGKIMSNSGQSDCKYCWRVMWMRNKSAGYPVH